MSVQKDEKSTPPYVSYKTFRNFIDGLRTSMPQRIDRSVMGTLSGGAQAQLFAALKSLGLISANGTPEPKLTRLVASEGADRQAALKSILLEAYPFLFADGFELQRATGRQLDEKFMEAGASGQTVRKCILFLLGAAKDAGIPVSPYVKPARVIRTRSRMSRVTANGTGTLDDESGDDSPPTLDWTQMLLAKFPSFDPEWSDDVKARWFEAFERLMKMGSEKPES